MKQQFVTYCLSLGLIATLSVGCGPSGNTVVDPGEGRMNEQQMQDYEKQQAEMMKNYDKENK